MNQNTLQSQIIEEIKCRLNPNISLVDELSDILAISKDSAYRRIRGDKKLDIDELQVLASHFDISLENLMSPNSVITGLRYQNVGSKDFSFQDYFSDILTRLKILATAKDPFFSYSARDIPPFILYRLSELAAFKIFFWYRFCVDDSQSSKLRFDLENLPDLIQTYLPMTKQIWEYYSSINSEEIWYPETPFTVLRQIIYCYESGMFTKKSHAELLLEQLIRIMSTIQNEAAVGARFLSMDNNPRFGGSFNLYINGDSLGTTTVLAKVGDEKQVVVAPDFNLYMHSTNRTFCDIIESHHEIYKKRSILISKCSEKERLKYFNGIKQKLVEYLNTIKS